MFTPWHAMVSNGFLSRLLPGSNWRHRCACIVAALWYALIFIASLGFAAYMIPLPNG
jgi:hypothetical protein